MTVINAVQIFMLLWGFTAVCQADAGNCCVRCNDVNGTVGEEVIFACSVPEQFTKDCVELYKFQYPKKYNDSCICRLPNNTCEKRSIFICRYTPGSTIKDTFRFFVQANSFAEKAEFTVNITEPVKPDAQGRTGNEPGDDPGQKQPNGSVDPGHEKTPGSAVSAISAGVGCFIIFIIIIILTIIILYQKHRDECQEKTFQVVRQKDDDNNTENM